MRSGEGALGVEVVDAWLRNFGWGANVQWNTMNASVSARGALQGRKFALTQAKYWPFCLAFLVLLNSANGQNSGQLKLTANEEPLHAIHEALFSSYLPIDELENKPELALFAQVREGIWAAGSGSPDFQQLLLPFADLRGFGKSCGIDSYLHLAGPISFASLTREQRDRVLWLLASCDENGPRRLAMATRNFYVFKTYHALEEPLSGVRLNLYAPHSWIDEHRPQLPPTRLRLNRKSNEIDSTDGVIDYLIVGSGPAGSVLAHELRRGGKRVVLIDRGAFIVPGSMQTRLVDDLLDSRTSDDGAIFIHNGMAVGGGSQVNVDLCFAPTLPAIEAKIESWRRDRRIGPGDFTRPQLAAAYEWVKSAIGTRTLSESEINANNHVLWDGAHKAGLHPKLYDLNTYAPGRSPYPVTDKRSSESQLLIDALEDTKNPLSLIPDAEVRRVLFENRDGKRRAVGVEVRARAPIHEDGVIADPNGFGLAPGESVILHARTVILAAGALGSPTILLRSGVANDQIGRGAVLHPSMPIIGKFDHAIDALEGTQASVYVDDHLVDRGYAFESMSADPTYAALMSPGPPMHALQMVRSYENLAGFGVMLIDAASPENRLVLDDNGEPRIHYELSAADEKRFRGGVAEAVRVMLLAGAVEVYLPTTENILGSGQTGVVEPVVLRNIKEADQVEKNLQFIPNRSIVTSAHMQATDKMGASPQNSVVGRDFHVWGTENLYVVDGSVFPTSIGANPMQSIYTFAKIFADRMIEQH
jgi:choline dehydrogenase-like flavoprotein